ncbi:MAG TPA: hypothetical protein VJS88_03545, partial [Chthoniobacterales bacterium]|nr:hypothetical protein [Chthoniobacterales bacterium]
STANAVVSPGQALPIKLEAINRSKVPVQLLEVRAPVSGEALRLDAPLPQDQFVAKDLSPTLPKDTISTQPYWLRKPPAPGTFTVDDQKLIGLPENPPAFPVEVIVRVGDQDLRYLVDTKQRSVDRVLGELREDLVIAPPVFANFQNSVFVFGDDKPKSVQVRVTASTGALRGTLVLERPKGWRVEPDSIPIDLKAAEAEFLATFTIHPPASPGEGTLRAIVKIDGGGDYWFARERISYQHIGSHLLMPAAEARTVRADIKKKGELIGYIPGAGDDIPPSLQQIGYDVKILGGPEITAENLKRFDAVVLGIRAYNTQDYIAAWQTELLAYVKAGGVVVVQYNTSDLKTKDIGPFPVEISRDRVTDETAEVRILAPDHPVLNTPNKITADDFKGWVQERGLYFPNKWDANWTPLLSSNDPGEKPLDGGLLVAKSGDGYFVYTGYAFFRQLPAGVPGAYRLFTNLVSLRGVK